MRGEKFLHLGNHKFLEGSAVSLIVMEGVLRICMVGVMGIKFGLFRVVGVMDLAGVGIRGSRYFPKAGILHPEA